jgi:hypothetical protein
MTAASRAFQAVGSSNWKTASLTSAMRRSLGSGASSTGDAMLDRPPRSRLSRHRNLRRHTANPAAAGARPERRRHSGSSRYRASRRPGAAAPRPCRRASIARLAKDRSNASADVLRCSKEWIGIEIRRNRGDRKAAVSIQTGIPLGHSHRM